jgi:DnaK suppressor protein
MPRTTATRTNRYKEIERDLLAKRRLLTHGVQGRMAGQSQSEREVGDIYEHADGDREGHVNVTLINMHAEEIRKIDAALRMLAEGVYGLCFECGEPIAEARLRANISAIRCKDCEEAREGEEGTRAKHKGPASSFYIVYA